MYTFPDFLIFIVKGYIFTNKVYFARAIEAILTGQEKYTFLVNFCIFYLEK